MAHVLRFKNKTCLMLLSKRDRNSVTKKPKIFISLLLVVAFLSSQQWMYTTRLVLSSSPLFNCCFFFCVLLDATLFRLAFFFVLVVYTLKYNTQTYSNDHYFIYTFVSPQFDLIFWLKLCLLKNKAYFKADDYDYNENQTNYL